jgi:hypothetical protein
MVFKYETHSLLENFPSNYLPDQFKNEPGDERMGKKKGEIHKFLDISKHHIQDYTGIPSSVTLLIADSAPVEDVKAF